jgi:hypothetical protein
MGGFKVSNLTGNLKEVDVYPDKENRPDEFLHITYNPSVLTLEMYERIREAAEDPAAQDVEAVKLTVVPMLVAWDLLDDDEGSWTGTPNSPVPCEEKYIYKVPLDMLGLILNALYSELVPNPQTPATSDDGSQQKGERAEPRVGSLS